MIGWGTPEQVALYVGRPARTIRTWANAGQITSACELSTRRIVVHAGDARAHSDTRSTRRRLLSASA